MNDFLKNLISGTLGGLIVFVSERIWEYRTKKKDDVKRINLENEKLIISPGRNVKFVEPKIVNHLLPGTSIDKVKSILGIADIKYKAPIETVSHSHDWEGDTNMYLYKFINTSILISSQDNVILDSITINFSLDSEHPIELIYPFADISNFILGEVMIDKNILESCTHHAADSSARDVHFLIGCYFGRIGNYYYYTFFGHDSDKVSEYLHSKDISIFEGEKIYSYCISNGEGLAPYIG